MMEEREPKSVKTSSASKESVRPTFKANIKAEPKDEENTDSKFIDKNGKVHTFRII